MASIHREQRGGKALYRLQFYDKDSKRRSMRLGAVNKKAADAIRVKVEDLLSALISGSSPSNETAAWLSTIGDDLADKLTTAGFGDFIPRRESATLGAFLDDYIEGRRAESADSTIANFKQLRRSLVGYFGADRDLRSIIEGDADDWRQSLVEHYAEATISKFVKRARQVFKAARRKGLTSGNPFIEVRGGSEQNDERKHFVDRETIGKVLAAAPNAEWRVIIALARYGGLRTPSELLRLRWRDIDWEQQRFTVTSPKTKKQGKPWRVVPLFPELKPYLEEAFDLAPDGAEFVISRYRDRTTNLRTQFERILRRAGVAPWPKLFQNLRASRETELVETFPVQVATAWLGNSPAVAMRHYLMTTEEHFASAVANTDEVGGATVGAVSGCSGLSANDNSDKQTLQNTKKAVLLGESNTALVPPQGLEP